MKAFLTDVATCNDCSQQFCHVTYRLCNCLLAVVPQYQLNELQAVMNWTVLDDLSVAWTSWTTAARSNSWVASSTADKVQALSNCCQPVSEVDCDYPRMVNVSFVTTIMYPGHLRSWSMRQFFRIGPRIDSHNGGFFQYSLDGFLGWENWQKSIWRWRSTFGRSAIVEITSYNSTSTSWFLSYL